MDIMETYHNLDPSRQEEIAAFLKEAVVFFTSQEDFYTTLMMSIWLLEKKIALPYSS